MSDSPPSSELAITHIWTGRRSLRGHQNVSFGAVWKLLPHRQNIYRQIGLNKNTLRIIQDKLENSSSNQRAP